MENNFSTKTRDTDYFDKVFFVNNVNFHIDNYTEYFVLSFCPNLVMFIISIKYNFKKIFKAYSMFTLVT